MSSRNVRVSELLKREISDILHTQLQTQSVSITITGVDVAPDHQNAVVFFSVIESAAMTKARAQGLLDRSAGKIRHELARRIVLKRMPRLKFVHDKSIEYGVYMNELMDSLAEESNASSDEEKDSR